jgi:VWFA-related protein
MLCLTCAALNTQAHFQSATSKQLRALFVDSKNHSLDDIRAEDIEVFEDGVRREASLKQESLPARYALLVDNSGSLRSQFPNVLGAVKSIVNANLEADETALVSFVDSSNIRPIQSFTNEKSQLFAAVGSVKIEGGHTAITDAVYATIEFVRQRSEEDKAKRLNNALVLITDGEDRDNEHRQESLFKFLRSQNVRVYSIGLISELDSEASFTRKSPRQKAEVLLQSLAKHSGGRSFLVSNDKSFQEALSEIIHDLHSDYMVTYDSASTRDSVVEIKVSKSANNKKRVAILQPNS